MNVRYDSFICDMNHQYMTWPTHMRPMLISYYCAHTLTQTLAHTHTNKVNQLPLCKCIYDVTRWRVWHDSFICVTWLIYVWHDSFMRDMEHSHCYCAVAFQTCLIQIWATTCLYVWDDAFTCVTWRIHMWHDSFIRHYGVATVSRID